jgi:tRNA (adenine-N(1)-)-methyltransferase non-catalytic subunit
LTVPSLTTYLLDTKEPVKILEMRNETLALMLSLANVHWGGRYLVVDESGGLLVAAVAERLGLLEFTPPEAETASPSPPQKRKYHTPPQLPISNTITLIHPNEQPNLSLLKYFSYDTNAPTTSHPLHTHLSTINWLQLTSPPPPPPPSPPPPDPTIKASKRAAHYRKLRRTTLAHAVATQTAAGSFDALLVAAFMDLRGILRHTIPLLRGSAQVVAYAQNREVVVECADCYSSARKAQWMEGRATADGDDDDENGVGDPTVVLAPTLHDVRVRPWQVLPGRTHPLMTGRGGAEGVVLAGTRVLPVCGKVEARGRFRSGKKKALDGDEQSESKKVRS